VDAIMDARLLVKVAAATYHDKLPSTASQPFRAIRHQSGPARP